MKVICDHFDINCIVDCPHSRPHEPIYDEYLSLNGFVTGLCTDVAGYCEFAGTRGQGKYSECKSEENENGYWPADCVQRAFVAGVVWWQFYKNGSTAFPSERDEAVEEAIRRYGNPFGEK